MKGIFIDYLIKNLIEKKDYILIRDENGKLPEYNGIRILEKQSFGSTMILEILDGDRFNSEELKAHFEQSYNILERIDRQSCYFFIAVVFDSAPDTEKLDIIKGGQYQQYPGKKFLSCVSVDVAGKKVEKHYKFPLSSGGLEKVIESILAENWQNGNEPVNLEEVAEKKEREAELSFVARTPYLSYILIGLNIIVFLAIALYGLQSNIVYDNLLHKFGAKNNFSILSGEYWRFVTPIFLHGGIVHLLVNCYSIYAIGLFVERLFGHARFALVYFAAGIIGNIASFMFSIHPGVGASGAIFGLFGALLYYGLENPTQFKRYFGYNVIITILINVSFGFTTTGIDNFAHIGGLIGGFLASGVVRSKQLSVKYLNRVVFAILVIAVTAGGLYYGFNNPQNNVLKKVILLERQGEENRWTDTEKTAEDILNSGDVKVEIKLEALLYAVQAEVELKKFDEAIEHGRDILKLDEKRGHYVLGVVYFNTGEYVKAKEELLEAKRLNAGFENIDEMLRQLDEILK